MTDFDLKAALKHGSEVTGLSTEVFNDKFTQKLKVLQDGGVKPLEANLPTGKRIFTLEEMAINQVVSGEQAAAKGDTEILFYLSSQDDVKLTTKAKKPFSNLHIVVEVGSNKDLFHNEKQQVEGCVAIRATHWNDKTFRPGFYRGKLNKSVSNGYTNYRITDIGTTERKFGVPAGISETGGSGGETKTFRVLMAYGAKTAARKVRDKDGNSIKDENGNPITEPVYKRRNGEVTQEILRTRNMEVLILNSDGTKSAISVSTVFDEWMDLKINPNQTYKGVFKKNVSGGKTYINLNSKPIESSEKVEIDDSLACDVLADISNIRDYIGKFVKLQPMFGDAIVEGKQNAEKGTKTSYTTISDMSQNTINIVGDPSVFDPVTNAKGNLFGMVQIIGKVFLNKERDNVGVRAYVINDISKGMPSTPVKIVENTTAPASTEQEAW